MPESLREQLDESVLTSIDPKATNQEIIRSLVNAYILMETITDLDDAVGSYSCGPKKLDSGVAIDPQMAAHCMLDFNRTRAFTLGLCKAVIDLRQQLGRTVRVLDIGSGPFAAIPTMLATLLGPEVFRFLATDVNPGAMEILKCLLKDLGLESHLIDAKTCNALHTDFIGFAPDIIICEVMHQALLHEPQALMTAVMGSQFGSSVLFLPERVEVTAATFDAATKKKRRELGRMITLDSLYRERARGKSFRRLQEELFVQRCFETHPMQEPSIVALETEVQVYERFGIPKDTSIITDTITNAGKKGVLHPRPFNATIQIDLPPGHNSARCAYAGQFPFTIDEVMQRADGKDPIYIAGAEMVAKARKGELFRMPA